MSWFRDPHQFRVYEYGRYHFTYFQSKRAAIAFAQEKADLHGGEWVVSKGRGGDYRCVKRVGPSYKQTSCVRPK